MAVSSYSFCEYDRRPFPRLLFAENGESFRKVAPFLFPVTGRNNKERASLHDLSMIDLPVSQRKSEEWKRKDSALSEVFCRENDEEGPSHFWRRLVYISPLIILAAMSTGEYL